VQATRLPARNNCSQYTPIEPTPQQLRALRTSPALPAFLQRVRGDMEQCLLQNSVIDALADDFAMIEEEEALKGHRCVFVQSLGHLTVAAV
jgi:hypothetical protein